MPAFLTHYTCGVMGYRDLPEGRLKSIIKQHSSVYSMGLAGPDLFFYSVFELATAKEPIGRVMHKFRTGAFLRALWDEVQKLAASGKDCTRYETALAYFCGFVGHYCLDTRAHALVYRVCDDPDPKVALGRHFRYEAAMDAMCCEKLLGRNIRRAHQMELLHLSDADRQVIADILSHAIRSVYGAETRTPSARRLRAILREYYLISGLLVDPTGFKEWLLEKIERKVPGYPFASPLFINDNHYGLGGEDWERFYLRFARGVEALERALALVGAMVEEPIAENYATEDFDAGEEGSPAYDPQKGEDASRKEYKRDERHREMETALWQELKSWSYHGLCNEDAASELPLSMLYSHAEETLARERKEREMQNTDTK